MAGAAALARAAGGVKPCFAADAPGRSRRSPGSHPALWVGAGAIPLATEPGVPDQRMPVAEGVLDGRAGGERPQHVDRGDGGPCQVRRDVVGDAGEPQDVDVDDLAPVAHRLQRRPVVVAKPEVEALACGGALQQRELFALAAFRSPRRAARRHHRAIL
jgi:hypothetical protein